MKRGEGDGCGRAARAAEAEDSTVRERLDPAEGSVHHLVNAGASRQHGDLLLAATRSGWTMDDAANVIALPASQAAQAKLTAEGIFRPVHNSGRPIWNEDVSSVRTHFRSQKMSPDPRPARNIGLDTTVRSLRPGSHDNAVHRNGYDAGA